LVDARNVRGHWKPEIPERINHAKIACRRDDDECPADADALWKRGASNQGFHYLGCAKTMALIGKAFAEATLEMEKR
jgi:hypothetical protein